LAFLTDLGGRRAVDTDGRVGLVTAYAQEVVTKDELRLLFEGDDHPTAYIGFEPSGRLHVGNVITANMVARLQRAGCTVTIFLADWHAMINDKFGGDLERIRACGAYQKEAFNALGIDPGRTVYRWASDLAGDATYWERVVRTAKASSLSRVRRALTIMGRKEDEADVDASKLLYPAMQVADIFHLGAQIALGGMDQRKAHMLARDLCEKTGWTKPVAVHTPLLGSLRGGERMDPLEGKMSKSDPGSAVTLNDTPEEIRKKMDKAFCPKEAQGNPVLEVFRYVVFESLGGRPLTVHRPAKFGGDLEVESYDELERRFVAGEIHPGDLKAEAGLRLEAVTAPVREHFAKHPEAMAWLGDGAR
jgi:tyrosyl-tRNA synthetase